jgi:prepilin-type processing-associated H-X9-DG protein
MGKGFTFWQNCYGAFTKNKYFQFEKVKDSRTGNTTQYYTKLGQCPSAKPATVDNVLGEKSYGMLRASCYGGNGGSNDRYSSLRGDIKTFHPNQMSIWARVTDQNGNMISGAGMLKIHSVKQASRWLLLGDCVYKINHDKYAGQGRAYFAPHSESYSDNAGIALVHNGDSNIAYLDGHVSLQTRFELKNGFVNIVWGIIETGELAQY